MTGGEDERMITATARDESGGVKRNVDAATVVRVKTGIDHGRTISTGTEIARDVIAMMTTVRIAEKSRTGSAPIEIGDDVIEIKSASVSRWAYGMSKYDYHNSRFMVLVR